MAFIYQVVSSQRVSITNSEMILMKAIHKTKSTTIDFELFAKVPISPPCSVARWAPAEECGLTSRTNCRWVIFTQFLIPTQPSADLLMQLLWRKRDYAKDKKPKYFHRFQGLTFQVKQVFKGPHLQPFRFWKHLIPTNLNLWPGVAVRSYLYGH